MTDFDDEPNSDAMPAADTGGAVELALHLIPPAAWQGFFALLKIAEDPKAARRVMRSLHDSLAAEAEAQKKTHEERAALAADKTKQLAEIAAERDVATKRLLQAQQAERSLEERRETVLKMERAWSGLTLPGEPPPLAGTLSRSKAYTGLERARYAAAHDGVLPDHPDKTPDQTVNYDSPPSVRTGTAGEEFPKHVSLTRTPEQSEAPAGARIRGRRSTDRSATP
jgi:hypothetical protein